MTRGQSPLFNIFHYLIGNDGGYWTIRWTDVSTAGFAVVPYIRGVTKPIKNFGLATMLKLLKSLFRHRCVFFLNLRIVYRGSNGPTLFIPSLTRLRTRMYLTSQTSVWYAFKGAPMQKAVKKKKNEKSALSEHACQTNHSIAGNNSGIITTNRRYHQRLCMEAWHINSAHAPLNRDNGDLLPDNYLHFINRNKRSLASV